MEEEEGAAAVLGVDEEDLLRKVATCDVPRREALLAGPVPGEDKERGLVLRPWIGKVWPRHPLSLALILTRTWMEVPGWHSEGQNKNNKRKKSEGRRKNKSMRRRKKSVGDVRVKWKLSR
jgi:hypothetical protein